MKKTLAVAPGQEPIHVEMTAEEIAEREADEAAANVATQAAAQAAARKAILDALAEIDNRSIRALRTGDTQRLADLEVEAATLRAQL